MASRNRKIPTRLQKKPATTKPGTTREAPVAVKPLTTRTEPSREESQQVALTRISSIVFGDNSIPDDVNELTDNIVLDDAETVWELKSFVDSKGVVVDPKGMRDFIIAVIQERRKNYPDGDVRLAPEDSLVFLSPALYKEQLNEERRDSLLLRKSTAVRGAYKCPKPTCGDDLVSTIQVQNRSFDEPSTNIHSCAICGTTWTSV